MYVGVYVCGCVLMVKKEMEMEMSRGGVEERKVNNSGGGEDGER